MQQLLMLTCALLFVGLPLTQATDAQANPCNFGGCCLQPGGGWACAWAVAPNCSGLGDVCICYGYCPGGGGAPTLSCTCYKAWWRGQSVNFTRAAIQRSMDGYVSLGMASPQGRLTIGHVAQAVAELSGWEVRLANGAERAAADFELDKLTLEELVNTVASNCGCGVTISEPQQVIKFTCP